jgi:adenylate kinase
MALNVIMMGPPGAGKGTQAERFARDRDLVKISTGDILREAMKASTPLGLRAKATIEQGKLVDDETMIGIVHERLMKPDALRGFVLDGFPRTVAQARALDEIMTERDHGPLIIVDVMVPEPELVRRLSTRRICATCGTNADPFETDPDARCKRCGGDLVQRADDEELVARKRLNVYERERKPLVDYYRHRPTFRVVNGAQTPDRVAQELTVLIDAVAGHSANPTVTTAKRVERQL